MLERMLGLTLLWWQVKKRRGNCNRANEKNYDLLLHNIKMNNLNKKVTPINIGFGDCERDFRFKYNGAP